MGNKDCIPQNISIVAFPIPTKNFKQTTNKKSFHRSADCDGEREPVATVPKPVEKKERTTIRRLKVS